MVTCLEAYMKEFDVMTGAFDSSSIYFIHMIDGDFMAFGWVPEVG